MQETALSQVHISLGAKMAEFACYNMPIVYSGIKKEHLCVRESVGVFDVSHMGEFLLKGEGALPLIQQVSSNDASVLVPGKVQYSCLPNLNGGIVDDLLIYMLNEHEYLLVVNASNIKKDWAWINQFNSYGADLSDVSTHTTLLAVQGPKAINALQKLTDINLSEIKYYHFTTGTLAGIDDVLISATGYTGSGGFELYLDNANAFHVWNEVFSAGKEFDIQPIGLAARDTLRLEKGFCLYGNDIDDNTSPIEAGLGWVTKFTKDFNSKAIFENQKTVGVKKKLVGFELGERGIARHDHEILDSEKNMIGRVTSGTMSPSLNKAIGMGYVTIENAKAGTEILINIRQKSVKAKVIKMPFLP